MLGGAIKKPSNSTPVIVRHTEEVVCEIEGKIPLPKDHLTGRTLTPKAWKGHNIRLLNLTTGTRTQIKEDGTTKLALNPNATIAFKNPALIGSNTVPPAVGDHIRIFWEEEIVGDAGVETAVEVTISPDTFPGTYRVVGDTLIRSQETGKDEAFQFVINKAKVQSNVTFTLQAEGDPTTFELTLTALRSTNDVGENEMMKLVRYGFSSEVGGVAENDEITSGLIQSSGT